MSTSVIIWVLISVSFTTYFIVSMIYKKMGINNLQTALMVSNGLRLLNLKHILGIVLFGILFYIIIPELRFLVDSVIIPKLHILFIFFGIIFLCVFLSKHSANKYQHENTFKSHYNFSNAWVYFIIRFAFLLCYEFFFRGVLLFKFLESTSLPIAIVYGTLLYVLIHIFDSRKEIIGAIPFGVVLYLFTYLTNSIWYAFFIHLSLSAVYEISVFYCLTFNKYVS
ncbi:CAAX protease self-immunity [Flaviramulus basaltis]|uniref:CAAX protease self-immunity n=1 Tax=Flaviramulus basaltis TaxID=369401 RepID=A0A1K2IPQ9_9FLAO|nr:CPBP family intramembrane glutamic endopeptidase [Flaviramulus basaltis]SFZ93683.1 CAAX protease self-immunity [Flaviramulus basaltis]